MVDDREYHTRRDTQSEHWSTIVQILGDSGALNWESLVSRYTEEYGGDPSFIQADKVVGWLNAAGAVDIATSGVIERQPVLEIESCSLFTGEFARRDNYAISPDAVVVGTALDEILFWPRNQAWLTILGLLSKGEVFHVEDAIEYTSPVPEKGLSWVYNALNLIRRHGWVENTDEREIKRRGILAEKYFE